jgi:hypothetical protein
VKRLRYWNTCCCKYHQELSDLLQALNDMCVEKEGVHLNCNYAYDMVCGRITSYCHAFEEIYSRLTNLWNSINV